MSRILVCLSNVITHKGQKRYVCFYENFLNALKDSGNEVLIFIPQDFNEFAFMSNNTLQQYIDEDKLRHDIISFDPELIISFNYAVYDKLIEITHCPFVIWNADLVNFWNQVDVIQANLHRFTFFCFGKPSIKDLQSNFPHISSKQIHVMPPATSIQAEDIEQDKNISFIGTNFVLHNHYCDFITNLTFEEKQLFNQALHDAQNQLYNKPLIPNTNKAELEAFKTKMFNQDIQITAYIAAQKRVSTVLALSDLGLTLYGHAWEHLSSMLPNLVTIFDDRMVYTSKHNQDIYNSSKICLNSMHPQCSNDLSWRVPDIMASNGCLFSEQSTSVQEIFGNFSIPMYSNAYEARELCIKLLKEDNLRHDIVARSQEIVAKDFTWKKRLTELQEITGVKLFFHNEGDIEKLEPSFLEDKIKRDQLLAKIRSIVKKLILYEHLPSVRSSVSKIKAIKSD